MKAANETYLGDGLYASFDGFTIWLRAPRETGDHVCALEPEVWRNLLEFVEQLKKDKAERLAARESDKEPLG